MGVLPQIEPIIMTDERCLTACFISGYNQTGDHEPSEL